MPRLVRWCSHSPAVTVLTRHLAEASALVVVGYEMAKAFPSIADHETDLVIPIVDNDQDISRLVATLNARADVDFKHGPPVYLIRGHGAYAWEKP